ncbi:glycosyltransferase family A protein [Paludibacterium sp. B53371]|uniref:glycosyltransferase family A protein n=1 Tax=Paludibacterium sp. B53371 TaxID=2806263 RepID=UPI001C043B83|nr:glycosyltransferase family A protein [Paludibacterium sp. B53371]
MTAAGLNAVLVESGAAVRQLLKQIKPDLIQTFSEQDHRQVARYALFHPTTLLATHLRAEEAIAAGRINHFIYNRLTDLNLFLDPAANSHSGSSGYLGLQNPVILQQDSLGGDIWQMLGHVYGSLLHPERLDVHHNIKRDFSDIKLAYITHFYCNQQDITSVTRLLERYAAYPPEVRAQVQFVIVDDGSPIKYQIPELPLNLTWIRIDQDIRWNQAGARNLGVVYARADTILMTDLDHELPLASMQQLLTRGSCGKRLYKMRRRDAEGKTYKGHSNFFVMSRGRFFECHGYDEEFAGHYGAEDFRFVKYQKARGSFQTYLPSRIYCIERTDIDRQRSYHSLVRDLSFNSAADSRKRRELAHVGHGYGHSRMFLNFTWTILSDQRFEHPVERPRSRWWKYRSLLRQVSPRF